MFTEFLPMSFWEQFRFLVIVFTARSIVLAGFPSLITQITQWARKRRIVDREIGWNQIMADMIQGLKILALDAITVTLAIHFGFLKVFEHSTKLQIFSVVGLMFVWFEIYFYYSHRIIHLPKLFWIHRHHHVAKATNPWTSLSFSLAERLILLFGAVAIPAAFSHWIPFSLEGFYLYFLLNYALNVYGHLNVEIMPMAYLKSPVGKVINTTTFHALHHLRFNGHFGLFTRVLDQVHNTEYEDYSSYPTFK